jgi:ornithine cyclodeaminase
MIQDTEQRIAPPLRVNHFVVIPGTVVREILKERRREIVKLIAQTYMLHAASLTINPDSYFLRFPEKPSARIIALPAYVGGPFDVAGIKWIASFPSNRSWNLQRASAVLLLNDYETGYPIACIEASIISASRTAASAALAARALTHQSSGNLGIVGAGVIARYTLEFLHDCGPAIETVRVFDEDPEESSRFGTWAKKTLGMRVVISRTVEDTIRRSDIILFATTASDPHVREPSWFGHNPTVLHLSLRDLAVEVMLTGQNILDDVSHCLKANTSAHLVEQHTGSRAFVAGVLTDVLSGEVVPDESRPRIFSPFGLGILDIALGKFVYDVARERGLGLEVSDFFDEVKRW